MGFLQGAVQNINLGGKNYTISSIEPSPKLTGDYWDEETGGAKPIQWAWDGTRWISREVFRLSIGSLSSGQVIIVGGVIGLLRNDSQEVPVNTGNTYSILLTKLDVGFIVTSGNLSVSNYWRLLFKSGGITAQTLNVTAGNNGETTGEIRKSSTEINQFYAHNGRYSIQLVRQGTPPDVNSPTATIEYRLVR